jgi:broad-specificity NMP kinase
MDSFIKIIEQKKEEPVDTLHTKQIELLKKYIRDRKNVMICGASGVGKTYILQCVLNETNSVEILKEHLSSKSHFLTFIKGAPKHAFIENYDSDFKKLVESVSDGNKLTRGSLIVTSTTMCMYPNFEVIFIPKHKPDRLLKLVNERSDQVTQAAELANGNIRNFFSYLDGGDEVDKFKTSKEFITDILCDDTPGIIYDRIEEHGHVWDVFQDNYLYSKDVDYTKVAQSFSDADIVDGYIYSTGNWHLIPYFCLSAVSIPKFCMKQKLNRDNIKPGSCWTKYGNYRMRLKNLTAIRQKTHHDMSIDHLCLLKRYAENDQLEPMLHYGLTPQDFDVMNHLAVGNKLKQRDVTRVKKALKNAIAERS